MHGRTTSTTECSATYRQSSACSNYHLLRTIRRVRARTANSCYSLHAEDRLGRGSESCTRICYAAVRPTTRCCFRHTVDY
jgi:hypothetical protein